MYENENYSDGGSVNRTGNAENGRSPYFDYTSSSAEELAGKKAEAGKENRMEVKKAKKERKPGGFRRVAMSAGLGLCFGLFAGAGFYGVKLGVEQFAGADNASVIDAPAVTAPLVTPDSTQNTATQIIYSEGNVSGVVKEVMPAMVSIVNSYTSTGYNFWGRPLTVPGEGSGSGIIIAENENELLIATNNHVVEGADNLTVTFIDGSTAEAVIKGTDSDMDLAVIAVSLSSLSQDTMNNITVATLGDSEELEMGEPVIAIGNALGYGQSVTNGIISALNREITLEDGSTGTFIQTNAAINPGNSGGALLNIKGEVIGINSNKIDGTAVEGMGYAIPISSASPIIADLMQRETRTKVAEEDVGYMGISMQEITDQIIQMYHMPAGVFVYSVEEGSAAQKAGIKPGDIIVKFDGAKVTSSGDLQAALQYYSAGETATVTVKRQVNGEYESYDLSITLGEKP